MQKPAFDPGLTRQFGAPLRRAINKDGSYNVRRQGVSWGAFHPWLHVVGMSWPGFCALVAAFYFGINLAFALFYYWLGPEAIQGADTSSASMRFMSCFFFSGQTFTTVGYGALSPHGFSANLAATMEALLGLLGLAIITGFLVARVSKPSARIVFSHKALIAGYQEGTALMFRIANERSNNLMELEAKVMLMQVTSGVDGKLERKFDFLPLERESVMLFPLTWTVVHPIDDSSPLKGMSCDDLKRLQAEVIVLLKGFDDTFSQVVHTRYSYRADEIVFNAKFRPAFEVEPSGDILLMLDKIGEHALER